MATGRDIKRALAKYLIAHISDDAEITELSVIGKMVWNGEYFRLGWSIDSWENGQIVNGHGHAILLDIKLLAEEQKPEKL